MAEFGSSWGGFGTGLSQGIQTGMQLDLLESKKQALREANALKRANIFFKKIEFVVGQFNDLNKTNKYGAYLVPQKLREARGRHILSSMGIDTSGKTNPEGKILLDTLIDKDPPTAKKALDILKAFNVSEEVRNKVIQDPQMIRNIVRSPMTAIQDYITQRSLHQKRLKETAKLQAQAERYKGQERRATALQPSALRKAEAEAGTAQSEQTIKAARALNIDATIEAELEGKRATTAKAKAETKETKLKADKLKMLLELAKKLGGDAKPKAPTATDKTPPSPAPETPARSVDQGGPLPLSDAEVDRNIRIAKQLAPLDPGAARALAAVIARDQATANYKRMVKIAEQIGTGVGKLNAPVSGATLRFLGYDAKKLGKVTPLTLARQGVTIPNPDAIKRLKRKQVAATVMISRGNRILKMVEGRPEILKGPGSLARAIVGMTSSLQGFARLIPGSEDAYNRIPQSARAAVEGVISKITEPGLKSAAVQSTLVDFVYRVGALADQTGKGFSDKDFENFAKVAAYGMSSPDAMKAVIRTLAITTQELYNIDFQNETGTTKSLGIPDKPFEDLKTETLQKGIFEKLLSDDQLQEYNAELQRRIDARTQ